MYGAISSRCKSISLKASTHLSSLCRRLHTLLGCRENLCLTSVLESRPLLVAATVGVRVGVMVGATQNLCQQGASAAEVLTACIGARTRAAASMCGKVMQWNKIGGCWHAG